MTAIAALVHDGKVWMGGDSAGVDGRLGLHLRKDPKVFIVGEFIIGFTTSFRMGQILRFNLNPEKPTEGEDQFHYMVTKFIPAVTKALEDSKWLKSRESVAEGGTFLVGWRGKLFAIYPDFQVAELSTPYNACGCAIDLILGSLYTTGLQNDAIGPYERVETSLRAAEAFSAGVRGPFTILSN